MTARADRLRYQRDLLLEIFQAEARPMTVAMVKAHLPGIPGDRIWRQLNILKGQGHLVARRRPHGSPIVYSLARTVNRQVLPMSQPVTMGAEV